MTLIQSSKAIAQALLSTPIAKGVSSVIDQTKDTLTKTTKWIYCVPLIALGLVGYRVISNYYISRKVTHILKDLRWDDTKTYEVATEILKNLKKSSGYIRKQEFQEKSRLLLKNQEKALDQLSEGLVLTAFNNVKKEPRPIINEWLKNRGWSVELSTEEILQKIREERTQVAKELGSCPRFYYLKELDESLREGEHSFASLLLPVKFLKQRKEAYEQVSSQAELNTLNAFDSKAFKVFPYNSPVKEHLSKQKGYHFEQALGHLIQTVQNQSLKLQVISPKKKATIFTCSYGTGHKSTADAVASYLDKYKVSIIDPTADVLVKTQWFHNLGKFFGKKWIDSDIFNKVIEKQLYWYDNMKRRLVNLFYKIFGIKGFNGITPKNNSQFKDQFRKRLIRENPDQIITTYHMNEHPILEVAKEMGVPVLHVATDFDCKAHELWIDNKPPENNNFKFSGWMDNPHINKTMDPLKKTQREHGGFCVRKEFYHKTEKAVLEEMRKERNLTPDTKVVLMMGGGAGQKVPYPGELAKLQESKEKIHLIVIAGKNNAFASEVENLKISNPNITIEVAKETNSADKNKEFPYRLGGKTLNALMDLADAMISKAGGISIAEALQKGVPLLFDHLVEPFVWEAYNIQAVKELGRGFSIKTKKEFLEQLHKTIALGKKALDAPNSIEKIPEIVEQMQKGARR